MDIEDAHGVTPASGLTKVSSILPGVSTPQNVDSLDRLCALAARLFDGAFAALLMNQMSITRVLASSGPAAMYRSYTWDFNAVPYDAGDSVAIEDARAQAALQPLAAVFGLPRIGFFRRLPVLVSEGYSVALLIAAEHPTKPRKARSNKILAEIIDVMRQDIESHAPRLTDPEADVTVAVPLAEIHRKIDEAPLPSALIDHDLRILAANSAMVSLLRRPVENLSGQRLTALALPGGDALAHYFRKALHSRLSAPEMELAVSEGRGARVFEVRAAPLSPTDTRDYFLHVLVQDVTAISAGEMRIAREIGTTPRDPVEPTLAFLDETLVPRRVVRARNGVSFLTLRSWRRAIRGYQITALKALKQNIPTGMPRLIAREMAAEIESFVGAAAFRAIVPVPCGHTREGPCLSVEIARALAAELGLPVVQAFMTAPLPGRSHPKTNARRPPLTLVRPLTEPALLVDDVATSGAHIEEAVKALKPLAGAVLPIVWISGDSA